MYLEACGLVMYVRWQYLAVFFLSLFSFCSTNTFQASGRSNRNMFLCMKLVLVVIYKREIADSLLECCGSENIFRICFVFFPHLNAFWVGSVQQLGVESCRVETKSRRSIVPNFCGRSLSWQASKTRNIVRSSWGIIESMSTKIKTNCWYLELLILSDSLTQGILRNFPFESSRRSRCWWDYSDLITIFRLVSGACDDKLRWNPRGRVNFERKQAHENIFPWSAPQKIRFGCTQKSRSQVAANRFSSGFLSSYF